MQTVTPLSLQTCSEAPLGAEAGPQINATTFMCTTDYNLELSGS